MVKIRSKQDWKGREINLPEVGKVTFNEKGEAVIDSKEHADYLVSIDSLQLELVGGKSAPSGNKAPAQMNKKKLVAKAIEMGREFEGLLEKSSAELKAIVTMSDEEFDTQYVNMHTEEEEEEEEEEGLSKEEKVEYINSLDTMNSLKELASAFPKEEWAGIKSKAKLKEYLIGKI